VQSGVIDCLHEAPEKAPSPVIGRPCASVNLEHARVTTMQLRVARRTAKHLGPVESEILYMRRIEAV